LERKKHEGVGSDDLQINGAHEITGIARQHKRGEKLRAVLGVSGGERL